METILVVFFLAFITFFVCVCAVNARMTRELERTQIALMESCWRVRDLERAISLHRAAHGQDRCWENDLELYAVLGEPLPKSNGVPKDESEWLPKCREYQTGQCKEIE